MNGRNTLVLLRGSRCGTGVERRFRRSAKRPKRATSEASVRTVTLVSDTRDTHPPEDVRELYHTWLVGLWSGELERKEPALPARHTDQDAIRRVTPVQFAQLLAALPSKQSTRISIARMIGEFVIPEDTSANGFVEYRNLCELGGFDASGPISVADIIARVGAGEYRVTAYGFEPRGLRWEVFVRLGEEPS